MLKKRSVISSNKKKSTGKRRRKKLKNVKNKRVYFKGLLFVLLSPFFWLFKKLWPLMWRLFIFSLLIFGGIALYTYLSLPNYKNLVDGRSRGSVTFLDKNGDNFAWRGDQLGEIITSQSIPSRLKHAIISTEDKRFYKHFGVSPRGVLGAIKTNLLAGRSPLKGHGGSTITQQTAKLICLGKEFDSKRWKSERAYEAECRRSTKTRKIKEAFFAVIMEFRYTKNEILSIYMNRAYLGAGTRGFQAASQRYFGISSSKLDISQAAMLAGLLKAPSTYAPTTNLQKAQSRAKLVINLMYAQNYITTKEKNAALKKPAVLSNKIGSQNSGYFVDWVMNTIPSFLTRKTVEDVVIKTTYDSLIQKKAEDALERVLKNNLREDSLAEVAVVILSPNGAVRGMIGGRKKNRVGSFNRAAQAKRQTGSIFKPFVYATALENGYQYNSILEDSPVTISLSDSENWSPQNYSRDYIGKTTLTDSMRLSINTIPVKLSENIGREKIINTARKLGLYNNLKNTPAISLGTSEHTLLEITGAYASILNSGNYIKPYGIKELRLKDSGEPLMRKSPKLEEKILTQETSEQLIYMMYRTIQDGTGTRAKISHLEAAGKTGTTQDQRDAWFIGFTSNYIVGVWLGNDYNKPLQGVTGGGLPAEIWKEIILNISKGSSSGPLPMTRPERKPTIKNGVYTQRDINKKFNIFRSLKNLLKRQ